MISSRRSANSGHSMIVRQIITLTGAGEFTVMSKNTFLLCNVCQESSPPLRMYRGPFCSAGRRGPEQNLGDVVGGRYCLGRLESPQTHPPGPLSPLLRLQSSFSCQLSCCLSWYFGKAWSRNERRLGRSNHMGYLVYRVAIGNSTCRTC